MTDKYDDLAAGAERGDLTVKLGTVRRGEAAAAAARSALMDATGATTEQEVVQIAVGRPPAGTKRGPSPVVRARVPQALKDRVHALAEREQRDESDIVREAVAAYVKLREVS
ncbi:ribbon-helix-helix protein, CopG family [Pseudactinotalea sp. Z1739]|uniref:ribbon-helix-helix protein, CopG family n=1 Tax=Pseudactinotalea sp. Z1739 TaxID=3413028 RepID=UPI003C7AACB1